MCRGLADWSMCPAPHGPPEMTPTHTSVQRIGQTVDEDGKQTHGSLDRPCIHIKHRHTNDWADSAQTKSLTAGMGATMGGAQAP